jgi:hypothetical protein
MSIMRTKEKFMKKIEVINLVMNNGDMPVIKNGVITVDGKAHMVGKVLCRFNWKKALEGILPAEKDMAITLFEVAVNPIMTNSDANKRKKADPNFDLMKFLYNEGRKAVRKELKALIQQVEDQGCSKVWCVYRGTKDIFIIPTIESKNSKVYGKGVCAYVELGIFGS